ncbi:PefC/AfrB family outer membrane usher protein [Escherichia coli]|uniref:PefC/AfrB family outer membrane usher protein n=1 Tax=Escherichia coli TaxID=562 RepID=UPI0007A61C17|nr:PefC/AfrB family outer membrane usher protein [Escherichia coli]
MSHSLVFVLSALTLALFSHYSIASDGMPGEGETELNTGFLQGISVVPSVLKSGMNFPAGQYYVDVVVNNDNVGKTSLTISADEEQAGMLCLSPEWLKTASVPIRFDNYTTEYHSQKQCYQLARDPYTRVDFNYGNQALIFSIPQTAVIDKTDNSQWDYGVNAFRLRYNGNVNHASGQQTSAYAGAALSMNVGRWVLDSNMSGTRTSHGDTDFAVRDAVLSTAIGPIRSDLRIGKSWTRNDQFADFGFYGVSLRSNSNMAPWESRGYAPLISGVANTTSRITITQNGYTMYSRVVQPGPYELNDVRPVGNGDLEVTVEDANGRKTVTRYPVTTLPTLLRPGELQYDLSLGRRVSRSDIKNPFSEDDRGVVWSGSLAYGVGSTTLSGASILHNRYRSGGISITQALGGFGAVSVGGGLSQAEYDSKETVRGHSINAKYAKSFTDTTNLQLMAYRYQSRGFVEFADFNPTDSYRRDNQKSRYEMQLTQRLPWNNTLSLSGWREDYWNSQGYSSGALLGAGFTLFDDVSFSLSAGYSKSPYREKEDYSGSLSVSIPFSTGGAKYYNISSVSHSSGSDTRFQTTVQGNPTDRLGYSVSAAASDKGSRSTSASANYDFDAVQTGAGISQDRHTTSVDGRIAGSIVATAESGLLFTRDQSSTMGVVRVPDVAGVRFNGSPETNSKGYTVVGLSDYSQNRIDIDMQYVPDSLELGVTSHSVVPTEKAVIYREFGASHVKRYFLQVRNRQGQLLSGGNARTEQGLDAGFIARNGVLSMSLLAEPKEVNVSLGEGKTCRIAMSDIRPGADKVQEVRCE